MADSVAQKPDNAVAIKPHEAFRSWMQQNMQEADGELIAADNLDRMLTADNDDDIWNADAGGTVQGRDAVGLEVEILDFKSTPSHKADIESNYYGTMRATVLGGPTDVLTKNGLNVGDSIALQTGAENILGKVFAFHLRGRLPIRAIITGTTTQSGNEVLSIRPLPVRSSSAKTE